MSGAEGAAGNGIGAVIAEADQFGLFPFGHVDERGISAWLTSEFVTTVAMISRRRMRLDLRLMHASRRAGGKW